MKNPFLILFSLSFFLLRSLKNKKWSLRCIVAQLATTPDSNLHKLPLLHRHAIPILSLAAFVYQLSLSLRRGLYLSGPLSQHRLPVTVISVGNLTWGGNGKTPMTEFVALTMADTGVSPLVLTRQGVLFKGNLRGKAETSFEKITKRSQVIRMSPLRIS